MKNNIEVPKLYNNPDKVIRKPGQEIITATIPASAEGAYMGNGEFCDSADGPYEIIGFDKTASPKETIWFGRGHFVKNRERSL